MAVPTTPVKPFKQILYPDPLTAVLVTWRSWLAGVVLSLIFITGLAVVQFASPNLAEHEGYYHIQMAYQMRTEGLKPDFTWLPLSVLNVREYTNPHFLYHMALIPFTFFDLGIGAKLAAVLFGSLAFLCVWRLLQAQRIPFAGLWAFGLMGVSEAFLFQVSIPQGGSLSLAALALGLQWMLAGRHRRLFWLAIVYVWLNPAFPLLLAAAVVYTLSLWFCERRFTPEPVIFTAGGLAAGMLVNPYFPYNLVFLARQLLPALTGELGALADSASTAYTTAQLFSGSAIALLAFASGIVALGISGKKMSTAAATFLLLALLTGTGMLFERSCIQYFPPLALLFAAQAWAPVTRRYIKNTPSRRWLPGLLLVILALGGAVISVSGARQSLRASPPYGQFAGAAEWLEQNTSPKERVFQTRWEDFSRLFFHNTYNTYLVGLDPAYLYLYNADLYEAWRQVAHGEAVLPSQVIRDQFGAHYIVSDLRQVGFLIAAVHDPGLQTVYRDDATVVFRVLSP